MATVGADLQGIDPKGQAFEGLAAVLYGAEGAISGAYAFASHMLASAVDLAARGLRGKRVLDLGCGNGNTALAVSRFAPARIIGVDSSKAHLDLFRTVLLRKSDLDQYLRRKGADTALDDLYARVLDHFARMRAEFRNGVFCRNGGEVQLVHSSGLSVTPADTNGPVDAVVGNHYLHWPVRAVMQRQIAKGTEPAKALARAMEETLAPVRAVLKDKGIAAFVTGKDFVAVSEDQKFDADLEEATLVAHLVYRAMQKRLNEILLAKHGIARDIPRTSGLFRTGEMAGLVRRAGFKLLRTSIAEHALPGNPIDLFFVLTPIWLGTVTALSVEVKIAIAKRVRMEMQARLTPEALREPVRVQQFAFILQKR